MRLAWVVSVVALACGGGGSGGSTDAGSGSDVVNDKTKPCAVDFPCSAPWACTDATHWMEVHSVAKPPCSGLTCEGTGVTGACDPGLECVSTSDKALHPTDRCAYGGVDGCLPGDASAFVPTSTTITAPTRQPNVCDQTSIEQFWARCFDPTTRDDASCTYWQQHNAACGACVGQTLVAAPWDIQNLNALVPNVAGCYAASGDATCASMADANMQCGVAVCNAGCSSDANGYAACIQAAAKTACSSFPLCGADAGAFGICEAPSEKDFFVGFGEALCGP